MFEYLPASLLICLSVCLDVCLCVRLETALLENRVKPWRGQFTWLRTRHAGLPKLSMVTLTGLSLSVCLSVCICLFVCLCLCVYLSLSVCVCLFTFVGVSGLSR